MKTYLTLLLILFTIEGYAQKCETKKDPFTGKEVIEYDFANRLVKFRTENEKIYLEMRFMYYFESNVIISEGTDFFIKLKNGEALNFKTNIDIPPLSQISSSNTIVTIYFYHFEITKKELEQLVNSEAVVIRYPDTKGGTLDLKLRPKARITKHLSKGSSCIFENLKL